MSEGLELLIASPEESDQGAKVPGFNHEE